MAPICWQPDRTLHVPPWPIPPRATAVGRAILNRRPAYGQAHLFAGVLRIVRKYASCRALLGTARADDAPSYFVILITGHIVIPVTLLTQKFDSPTSLQLTVIFVPHALVLPVGLLRRIKGPFEPCR